MGIDPVTHKPFSHLMAEIATTLAPPQVAHLAEAALGCFKDEMLHLLTKKRVDFQLQQNTAANYNTAISQEEKDNTVEKIKLGLSRAIQEPNNMMPSNQPWDLSEKFSGTSSAFPTLVSGFEYSPPCFGNEGTDLFHGTRNSVMKMEKSLRVEKRLKLGPACLIQSATCGIYLLTIWWIPWSKGVQRKEKRKREYLL